MVYVATYRFAIDQSITVLLNILFKGQILNYWILKITIHIIYNKLVNIWTVCDLILLIVYKLLTHWIWTSNYWLTKLKEALLCINYKNESQFSVFIETYLKYLRSRSQYRGGYVMFSISRDLIEECVTLTLSHGVDAILWDKVFNVMNLLMIKQASLDVAHLSVYESAHLFSQTEISTSHCLVYITKHWLISLLPSFRPKTVKSLKITCSPDIFKETQNNHYSHYY